MSKKAILCLDDERIILTSLQDQLFCSFGDRYIYEFAESIEEAWEVIKELGNIPFWKKHRNKFASDTRE